MSRRGPRSSQPSTSASAAASNNQDGELTDPALLAIHYGMKNILELAEDVLPTCPTDEERQKVIDKLDKLMLKFVKSEMSYLHSGQVVEEAAEEIPDDENVDDKEILASSERILPLAEQRLKVFETTLSLSILKEHKMYKTFMQQTQQYMETEDESEDLMEESILADETGDEHIPTVDPISKEKLTDPVKNKRCGHIYGNAAILALIKTKAKVRCPMMGCSNKNYVKAKDLVSDPKLTALVRKKIAEQETEEDS